MTTPRPTDLFPDFASVEGLDEAYAARYPHANVALAVARLRSSLGLTQAEFASRIGTTQSVVARLESGRHGIQASLLDRIAAAFGTRWEPVFGTSGPNAAEPAGAVAGSGDALLDAFNEANTRGAFDLSRRIAGRISREPLTPRREVALALDAFNRRSYARALQRARSALGGDLPHGSRIVASLVAGRSLLALGQAPAAMAALSEAGEGELAEIARCEALMAAERHDEAVALAERLLAGAEGDSRGPVSYLAALAYWHADRAFEALTQVGAFRALEPDDRDGRLLNGAILGLLGDAYCDEAAHRRALALFLESRDRDDLEAERLLAMTSARLGDWQSALSTIADVIDRSGRDRAKYERAGRQIALDCFIRLEDADALDTAADDALARGLIDPDTARSQHAEASAMRGDYEGAVKALGRTDDDLHLADPRDQVRCAIALEAGGRLADAHPILVRVKAALPNPDGQLLLARACLAARDTTSARAALESVTACDGAAGETAKVALELVKGIERTGATAALASLQLRAGLAWGRLLEVRAILPAPRSPWEGPQRRDGAPEHDAVSPVLSMFTMSSVGAVH